MLLWGKICMKADRKNTNMPNKCVICQDVSDDIGFFRLPAGSHVRNGEYLKYKRNFPLYNHVMIADGSDMHTLCKHAKIIV